MTQPTVSVIVVSRGRPDALARCLAGMAQLQYTSFEVIVVADPEGCAVVPNGIKVIPFDVPNISMARNLGMAHAAGTVVAFIDDDAVPMPDWLLHLCGPFKDPKTAATGGFVIGRNGISHQWQARMAFPDGSATPMQVDHHAPTVLKGQPGRAIKTEGTNMAFRRDQLLALGGFDPAFAFYLDETDVNMRLAATQAQSVIVPTAIVHHGFSASERRTAERVPRTLYDVAKSLRRFVTKHDSKANTDRIRRAERTAQRDRLLIHMRNGGIMPGDVRRILKTFDSGWKAGHQTDEQAELPTLETEFEPYSPHANQNETRVFYGRFWQRRKTIEQAISAVAQGYRVHVILLSYSAQFHRITFDTRGFWVQRGGQFGKSDRDMPLFRFWRAKTRIAYETQRFGL